MASTSTGGVGAFIGNSVGEAAAFAAGLAIGPLLEPLVQALRNETWSQYPDRPIDAATLAQGVAEGKISADTGRSEARLTGIAQTPFDTLVAIFQNAPSVAEAIRLIQRGQLPPSEFPVVLERNGLEPAFRDALAAVSTTGLKPWEQPLQPAEIALAIVRNLLADPGFLPKTLDTDGSSVPAYPQSDLDAVDLAAETGVTREELRIMVGTTGRPSPVNETARAVFRGIANRQAFNLSILEGDIRPEYADLLFEVAREILTAHDWVELHLRGYITDTEMYAGTALHGMSQADTDRLFRVLGRPLTVHQITTGLARGGQFNPIPGELTDPYEASVHESNIKPSYYDLAIANRYSYPSLFQLNALVKASAITADTARDWATKEGLAPEVVDALFTFWQGEQAGGTTTAGVKPKTFTYSQIHQAWRNSVFTDAEALAELEAIGYPAAKAATLLATWKATQANTPTGG